MIAISTFVLILFALWALTSTDNSEEAYEQGYEDAKGEKEERYDPDIDD